MHKAALPFCELLAIEAKFNNTLLKVVLKKETRALNRFQKLSKNSSLSSSGLNKVLTDLLEYLVSHDRYFAEVLGEMKN